MLVFCHLFVGAAIGLALAQATGDRRLILAGLFAGILPDLIDKPLGHLMLASTLDNGRLVAHSLAFVLVLLVAGALLLRGRGPLLTAVLALGVLSHQLLDAMWRDPSAWFFPLLGPFVPGHYPDYFLSGLAAELGTPSEWLFGAATLALVLAVVRPAFAPADLARSARRLLPVLAVGIGLMGLLALVAGALGLPAPFAPGIGPRDMLLLGLGSLGGAVVVHESNRSGRDGLQQLG
jgi:membrane-bound metal-dependent hydrolase YbcI (DUF457 family)